MSKPALSTIIVIAIIGTALYVGWNQIVDTNYAGYSRIVQYPITGKLSVRSNPGMFWKLFGTVTEYKLAGTYTFTDTIDIGDGDSVSSPAVEVRFNDGGIAQLSGNARFELPTGGEALIRIHKQFRSYDHVAKTLIRPAIAEALILTASLMSSEDSYAGRRAEFRQRAWDQVTKGVYRTAWEEREWTDPITGETKVKRVPSIMLDKDGVEMRDANPLESFGITVSQFFLDKDLQYEPGVKQQIQNQRDAMMQTVAAKAEAEKAQQDKLTAEAQGQALVMSAKYEAEVDKERAVVEAQKRKQVATTDAEQRLQVARLDMEAASAYRDAQLLRAEGDAGYKTKVMAADGALEQKLKAWLEVNRFYADAIQNYQGAWVPGVVMGASGQAGANGAAGALDLVNLLTVKTARDLALDVGIEDKGK